MVDKSDKSERHSYVSKLVFTAQVKVDAISEEEAAQLVREFVDSLFWTNTNPDIWIADHDAYHLGVRRVDDHARPITRLEP